MDICVGEKLHLVGRTLGADLLVCKPEITIGVGGEQVCVCPHCRRTLNARIDTSQRRPMRSPPVLSEKGNAYAALMYGSPPAYFVGAMVTGWSLAQFSSLPKSSRLLLCTDDVPESFRLVLSEVWTIVCVEYISKASSWLYWDYYNSRFKQVFTKLRVIELNQFKKIVLLDLDLLIRAEIDHLFDLDAPAAMVRGQAYLRHGEEVAIDTFYHGHRQVGGINCGVMLIEPSCHIFSKMLREVREVRHPEHWPSHGPEQDYLGRFYNTFEKWTNISCRYNYQVHLNQYGSLEWHHHNRRGHPDVTVFHFSGKLVKPWEFVLDLFIVHNFSFDEIEMFVRGLYAKALDSMKAKIEELQNPALIPDTTNAESNFSQFCRGTGRCYLEKYIHASWTEADSEAVIEWIHAFKETDESIKHAMTNTLRHLWNTEQTREGPSYPTCKYS